MGLGLGLGLGLGVGLEHERHTAHELRRNLLVTHAPLVPG